MKTKLYFKSEKLQTKYKSSSSIGLKFLDKNDEISSQDSNSTITTSK